MMRIYWRVIREVIFDALIILIVVLLLFIVLRGSSTNMEHVSGKAVYSNSHSALCGFPKNGKEPR